MEVLDSSENTASLYSISTLASTEDFYYDAATEFDNVSEDLEDRLDNSLWQLEEGCDLQLLHLLPMELLNRVLGFCSPTTLCHLGRCSTQTLVLTSQSFVWRDLMLRHWGPDLVNGLFAKKKTDYEAANGNKTSNARVIEEEGDLSEATASIASNTSTASANNTANTSNSNNNLSVKSSLITKCKSNASLMDLVLEDLLLDDDEGDNWEEWKQWYRDAHRRAARLIRFDVRGGIKELIDHHGLPNTTGAIARTLKSCMGRIASFALRDFLHQQPNANLTSYFLRLWNFKGISVLQMMRLVLGFVRLPRSDSSISRVLEILALAWWEQNLPTPEEEAREAEAAAAAALNSSVSGSPPGSPPSHARNPLATPEMGGGRRANADPNPDAGGDEEENGENASARKNAARLMQHIHLAPLATLDGANPWEQMKVPVILTEENLKPRGGFHSPDAISTLCFAILMLETDQRTSAVKMKMTESAFISQSRGLNSGRNYPREMLRETYNSIKFHPLVLFADRVATGRIQVHTSVPRFLWLSSKSTTELRAEVARGFLTVWELDAPNNKPIHSIPLTAQSTIVRCDLLGPSWLSGSLGTDDNPWNTVEVESLSVLGSSFFKFMVPAEQTQKWFSALHWNIHALALESRAPLVR